MLSPDCQRRGGRWLVGQNVYPLCNGLGQRDVCPAVPSESNSLAVHQCLSSKRRREIPVPSVCTSVFASWLVAYSSDCRGRGDIPPRPELHVACVVRWSSDREEPG
eukprot:781841-Rhodomonas_salina.1